MLDAAGAIQELKQTISETSILFFDLDGTLIDTDYVNYLSYKSAIELVIESEVDVNFNPNERFDRELLKKLIHDLSNEEYEKIVHLKNKFYEKLLHRTKQNDLVVKMLKLFSKTNRTILVTNCREERAIMTLEFHGLADNFTNKFYALSTNAKNKINKYESALFYFKIPPSSVIIFENERKEINNAIIAGIPKENIVSI